MTESQKILYLARVDIEKSLGIHAKLKQSAHALAKRGHDVQMIFVGDEHGFWGLVKSYLSLLASLFKYKPDTLIVRADMFSLGLVPGLIWQRIMKTFIIIDVPTPVRNWIAEQDFHANGRVKALLKKTILRISYPVCLWPAHKIVHYAAESPYFLTGLASKAIMSGNGIDVEATKVRRYRAKAGCEPLVLLGVASVAEWHGFDRIIAGMHKEKQRLGPREENFKFIVVGDGPGIPRLRQLSTDLDMHEKVRFEGFCAGSKLDDLFDEADIAVSSIGLHRVGLEFASSLKSREYAARGIPFIAGGRDIDFESNPFFLHQIEDTESPVDMERVRSWYGGLDMSPEVIAAIRMFAAEHLCFSVKTAELIQRDFV